MAKTMRVCVVIPAYNESAVIKDVAKGMIRALKASSYDGDVVVVNDGSKDTTAEQARLGGASVINHILNSGAGAATATGLSYAEQHKYDFAATMDADGQHLAADVIKGFDRVQAKHADLLIGSRLIDKKGMSRVKMIGNRGLSIITYILFGINSTDSQSGLRIFSSNALKKLRWQTSGYEFCSEMLWRARQIHLNIDEFPITAVYTEYSKNKGQNNWNGVNIVKSLMKRRIMEMFE